MEIEAILNKVPDRPGVYSCESEEDSIGFDTNSDIYSEINEDLWGKNIFFTSYGLAIGGDDIGVFKIRQFVN